MHESAEVVEYLHEVHVQAIVNLLNTHGREEKVSLIPIGYSVIVALTGLPIGYSVIVALTGLPIG